MGRDIVFLRANPPANLPTNDDDDSYEAKRIVSVSLGSGDAWPCYLRPIFIAGYRRLQALGTATPEILEAIVECCPPDHTKVDNTRGSCGFFGHVSKDFGSFGLRSRHDKVSEPHLFRARAQLLMDKAGLWPCVEILLMHHRAQMATPTIRRVSTMMQLLHDYIPFEEEHLIGTPYDGVNDDYNLADDRWNDLRDAFALAASEDDVIGLIE